MENTYEKVTFDYLVVIDIHKNLYKHCTNYQSPRLAAFNAVQEAAIYKITPFAL